MQFDSVGLSNFFKIFAPSIQFGAAGIIFITLWLTAKRMEQTQMQIDLSKGDFEFTNFYKHREEFTSFFKKMAIFNTIAKHQQYDIDGLIYPVYSAFFNKGYQDFEPRLNSESQEKIMDFIKKIKNSSLSEANQELTTIPLHELQNMSDIINPTIEPIVSFYTETQINVLRQNAIAISGRPVQSLEDRFRLISNLYWTFSIYENILLFDGISHSERASFAMNFTKYCESLGIL